MSSIQPTHTPHRESSPQGTIHLGVECPSCRRSWVVDGELPSALLVYFCSPMRCGFCSHPRMEVSEQSTKTQLNTREYGRAHPRSNGGSRSLPTLVSPTEFFHLHSLPQQLPTQEQLEFLLLPAHGEFLQLPHCTVLKKLHFPTHTLVFGVHTQGAVVVKCLQR